MSLDPNTQIQIVGFHGRCYPYVCLILKANTTFDYNTSLPLLTKGVYFHNATQLQYKIMLSTIMQSNIMQVWGAPKVASLVRPSKLSTF